MLRPNEGRPEVTGQEVDWSPDPHDLWLTNLRIRALKQDRVNEPQATGTDGIEIAELIQMPIHKVFDQLVITTKDHGDVKLALLIKKFLKALSDKNTMDVYTSILQQRKKIERRY